MDSSSDRGSLNSAHIHRTHAPGEGAVHSIKRRDRVGLLDHLVSEREHLRRQLDAESFGGFEIEDQFKLGGLHNRQVRRLLTLENPGGVDADLAIRAGQVADRAVGFMR